MTDAAEKPADRVPSPCVRNCCLDQNDVCVGCRRTLAEILAWHQASEDEKREILRCCRLRREQGGSQWPG